MTEPIVFTEEQALVGTSARDLLATQVSFDHVRAQIDSEAGYDEALFREIAEFFRRRFDSRQIQGARA